MMAITEDRRMLGYGSLDAYPDIIHFVTTRTGGCSEGAYGSFNCSPFAGDEPERVARNQERLLQGLPQRPIELVIPHQTHSPRCLVIDGEYLSKSREEQRELSAGVDATLTGIRGYCLCVSTADCVPVLLYDTVRKAVAAIHAGWRGTVQGIVEHTLQQMAVQYGTEGKDVVACIGPSISQASFEVGEEVYDAFRDAAFPMEQIAVRNPQTGKAHIDLWEANRLQLLAFGVPASQIETAGICTYKEHETFFSARRLGIASGRILSGIMIK